MGYPRDGFSFDSAIIDNVDKYRDLNLLYEQHVGEETLSPFISFTDMKDKLHNQVSYQVFQIDLINPGKFNYLKITAALLILLDCLG